MDHIVEQVLAKIRQREHQSYEVDYSSEESVPDKSVYTDYANVTIDNVTIPLLANIYRLNLNDPWTKWVLQGISFQVNFTFQISSSMVNFIPKKMLLDWPVSFVVDQKRSVTAFYQKAISRSDLAILPDKSIIVVTPNQKITDEAKQISQLKQMIIQMRSDGNCIWHE
ncbi:PduM family microcompartment protein [Lentilactobacillus kisonensis]|nr:PduM family microcompartment protein [Lentilactobacillus kisonensis]